MATKASAWKTDDLIAGGLVEKVEEIILFVAKVKRGTETYADFENMVNTSTDNKLDAGFPKLLFTSIDSMAHFCDTTGRIRGAKHFGENSKMATYLAHVVAADPALTQNKDMTDSAVFGSFLQKIKNLTKLNKGKTLQDEKRRVG